MKYNGKYSLLENFDGRGLGLLSEKKMYANAPADYAKYKGKEQTISGTKISGSDYDDPASLPTKSGGNAGANKGWNSGRDLAIKLKSLDFTIEYIAGGNVGPDVQASKGGNSYAFELGTASKVTQMGSYDLAGKEMKGRQGMEDKRKEMKKQLVASGAVGSLTAATPALRDLEILDADMQQAYWLAAGDDFIVYKDNASDTFFAMALTDRAHALMPKIPFWDDLKADGKIPDLSIRSSGSVRKKDPVSGNKVKAGNRYGTQPFGNIDDLEEWKPEFSDRYKEI